ncbi:MAG: HAD-IIA family hydrolase [Lentisphaerae bacterium]|nr:HAD-IIA family hydrolase [Lentisphaerota bacterium]
MIFRDFWQSNISADKPALRAILFDVDGTIVSGRTPIPGAEKTLNFLRENNTPFLFLTNDSHHSPAEKARLIGRAGVEVNASEIISCSHAVKSFAEQHDLVGRKVFIMGEFGEPCYAEAAGLIPCRNPDELDECEFVIAGEGRFDWHDTFQAVMNYFIDHRDRKLVVANPDSYWPNASTGKLGIGAGAQARFIAGVLAEMKIDIDVIYLGKPYPAIYQFAVEALRRNFNMSDLALNEVLMVGDSLTSDIAGAEALGMPNALVLSGITTPEIFAKTSIEKRPALVFDSIG